MAQAPTCTGIRIRHTEDANRIFHAVALGHLQLYRRRLTVEERRSIHTGCIFVWEERNTSAEATGEGIERWTDGRRWSCSKVKLDFLFYQEKLPDVKDEQIAAFMRPNQLVKQTYSVFVQTPFGRKKWHLVAYYTPDTRDHLHSVDDIPLLRDLRNSVPPNAYHPARTSRTRTRGEPMASPDPQNSAAATRIPVSHIHVPPPRPPSPNPSTPDLMPPSWGHDGDNDDGPEMSSTLNSPVSSTLEMPFPFTHDPKWILENCVAVCNIYETPHRSVMDESMALAPLIYMKDSPYQARQPFDVDALRALETVSWSI
ncbi:hypothetical protein QCA50_003847 [Cerrena zonata]|uniref:cAMP-independent regulatory protein pac2 n=1 Tax=Cerrena zonata TaxID=2478898 RepID=A0AAW0GPR5_9APHY